MSYITGYDSQRRKTIQFHPSMFLCFSKDGDIEIDISVRRGALAADKGRTTIDIKITDIDWREKCQALLSDIPAVALLLLYIFGLFYKAKFCRNQRIGEVKSLYDVDMVINKRRLSSHLSWWQRFVPYRAERLRYNGMIFIAATECNAVYLSGETKSGVKIEGDSASDTDMRSVKIYSASLIELNKKKYFLR